MKNDNNITVMVKVYSGDYPKETKLKEQENYNFELDNFQKYAIQSINENKHVLITAHTGSGKTLPAEYAIEKFCGQGKKVIYTAPIKSLSNQKFNEFTQKFPTISFGILTGDIKFNPEADCLIMTTEILRNTLFQQNSENNDSSLLNFSINMKEELGCIIFDEVHYINDEHRGKVWEESIMLIPDNILMVMLSATIDKVEVFAEWVEKTTKREVCICSTNKRVVPLTHYGYLVYPKSFYNGMPNEESSRIQNFIDEPRILKEQNKYFNESNLDEMRKINKLSKKNQIYVKSSFVLQNVVKHLNDKGLLPAICFVFSRKNVERFANELNLNLIENGNEVEDECLRIVKKLPNYKEYVETSEYKKTIRLLRKGIAIHHSGIIPILKEMTEMLFSKGFIKVLFATETFAVGVNMPAKTVLFCNLQKFNGGNFRYLLSHEYTQMAGRAGRRGLDTIGVVIHLLNLFEEIPNNSEYKFIVDGKPQNLVSKFKIHYNLLLRILSNNSSLQEFVESSMITNEIRKEFVETEKILEDNKKNVETMLDSLKYEKQVRKYNEMLQKVDTLKNKQRKRMLNEIKILESEYPVIIKEVEKLKKIVKSEEEIEKITKYLQNMRTYVEDTINIILDILKQEEFIEKDESVTLTEKGLIATQIQEVHSLVMATMLHNKKFNCISSSELASLFSIFTSIRVSDTKKRFTTNTIENKYVGELAKTIETYYDYYYNKDCQYQLDIVEEYELTYDIVEDVNNWCEATNEQECNAVLSSVKEKGIFVGEFVKAILKINNIASEIEKVCNITNNMELLKNIMDIPKLTMKYIVSTQSLYL